MTESSFFAAENDVRVFGSLFGLMAFGLGVFAASLAETGVAETNSLRQDVREECRLAVSGRYVALATEIQRGETMINEWQKKRTELDKSEKQATSAYEDLKKRAAAGSFDMALEEQRDGAFYRLELIRANRDELSRQEEKAKKELVFNRSELERFAKKLPPVFKVEKLRVSKSEAPTYQVLYRRSCPPYKTICALPPSEAKALVDLWEGEVPTPCQRYSQVLPPPE